ncbi:MAG TPA: efflux RND transporter periplasmic adaptor subunit [Terriglobia bacterium]|nr:efflux RND transporter periplasmic adaptor subunit [Terriglobia bacterium]
MSANRKRRIVIALVALAILAAAGFAVRATLAQLLQTGRPGETVPTVRVERGDVSLGITTAGALTPGRTAMMIAPPVAGGALQISHLLKTGTRVKPGDIVIEFDPAEQEYTLQQSRTDLAQAEQEITKAGADAAVQTSQDQVALLKDKFDVRRAELEVSKKELVSAIDAKKNELALQEAQRALAQLESDIKSHAASNQATLAVSEEKRRKAALAMQEAQRNIDSMKVRSTIAGLVEVKPNQRAAGNFFFTGMVLPEYHEGDQAGPGSVIAAVVDPAKLEIQAKVNEGDRANLSPGQAVQVAVNALPGRTFAGRVKSIAGLASKGSMWQTASASTFDVTIELASHDPELRPGYTAQVSIAGNPLKDVLYLPPQAVFDKNGNPVVYLKTGGSFHEQPVKIKVRAATRVVVEGLSQGAEVALVDPEAQGRPQPAPSPAGPAMGGGGM